MKRINKWILIGVMVALGGLLSTGVASASVGLPQAGHSLSLMGLDHYKIPNEQIVLQLEAAIREILQIEPAYRVAQAEVKEVTRQIRPFLPLTLETSELFDPKIGDWVAILGMKKMPMKEDVSNLRFETKAFTLKMSKLEPVREPKKFFIVLRE